MTEWKDLKKEFPTDRSKLYLVRSVRPALGGFVLYYLCQLTECTWNRDGRLELSGMSCNGRRFCQIEPKSDDKQGATDDLFRRNAREEVQIHWKEIDR